MAPQNGGFGQTSTEGTRGPSRPSRPGLRGRPPRRRPMLRLRAPAQQMLQRDGRAERARPRRGAQRTGSARPRGGPGRRAGGFQGRAWRWAPAVRAAVRRRGHASAAHRARLAPGLPLVLRVSKTGDPPRIPPLRLPEKLPRLGRQPARRGVGTRLGLASSRLCARGSGVGRKPQTRAARRRSPPPFAGGSEAPRSCGGGTRPEPAQRKPTPSCLRLPAAGEGATAALQDS